MAAPLTASDLRELTAFRRELHAAPELSGAERDTAAAVRAFLAPTGPDAVVDGLGGHGVAVVYEGDAPGPTLLLRAELDALPIQEVTDVPYRSTVPGAGHHCGHDGHMAILAGVARDLGRVRPRRGRAVLLFQPSEEDGEGAAAVIADPAFAAVRPDLAISLHNLSWVPLGHAELHDGPVNCASHGLRIVLTGRTAHASAPEDGVSPAAAVARLIPEFTALGGGELDEDGGIDDRFRLVTVTHVSLGEESFGVAPGRAELWATLRTLTDDGMAILRAEAERVVRAAAAEHGLGVEIDYLAVFPHCENDPDAAALLRRALQAEGVPTTAGAVQRGSEDFGRFRSVAPSAMFFLGSGRGPGTAHMHNPDFDFPDELIDIGARVFLGAVREFLG